MKAKKTLSNDLKIKMLVILNAIRNAGGEISAKGLMTLISVTNNLVRPTIAILHNYTSDKTGNTELADYTLNIGVKYERAKGETLKTVANLDLTDMLNIADLCTPTAIKGFQYIDRKGVTAEAYCTAVKAMIPKAIEEMQTVKDRPNENVIHINPVLSFNANTGNLLLSGELIKGGKSVSIEGEVKMTAKAPKTVAKEVVRAYLNARTSKIRSFNISNLNYISVAGQKIELVKA